MGRASVRHTSNRSKCTTLSLKLTMPPCRGTQHLVAILRIGSAKSLGFRQPAPTPLSHRLPIHSYQLADPSIVLAVSTSQHYPRSPHQPLTARV